jgi:monooxygenase
MAEHVDVVIVGAGLSGVGAACHLRRDRPGTTFTILESREAIGGTWDLFRYPGVRSDSDMFTLSYPFRPWTEATAIADGPVILDYVRATAREFGVDEQVRFGHKVLRAEWSSDTALWTVTARHGDEDVVLTCRFLFCCSGYYRYDEGFTPEFPGLADFAGRVVHPQAWPDDLEWTDQRVVVIGSGATAVTLVPAMAEKAARVTMLQRSPTYIAALPTVDPLGKRLRKLPTTLAYRLTRWKNVLFQVGTYQLSRRRPEAMKKFLRKGAVAHLPRGFDVDTHLSPRYEPWDQRLCVAPDGDLFTAIAADRAEIVTDRIARITPAGVQLESGRHLDADILVTATGLNLLAIGGIALTVDGAEVKLPETVAYKGLMLSGVPNFALTVGYTNASWTLKADLIAGYVVRLLDHLDAHGYRSVVPVAPDDAGTDRVPLIDLRSGYVLRSVDSLPKQGATLPWRAYQNYLLDSRLLRHGPVTDHVQFS